jgi:hypothetical protein
MPIFDTVAVVDWSAAASPGPARPSPDRCWVAWQERAGPVEVAYFRTRHTCLAHIGNLARRTRGAMLCAFDFPFGYPAGSGLGGGRAAGRLLSHSLQLEENDGNNRFHVAAMLNRTRFTLPGPFWGRPAGHDYQDLTTTKPPFHHTGFREWRLVEAQLKQHGHRIMNVWQLLGRGSVGSQTITGLTSLYRFSELKSVKNRIRFWPFETGWNEDLRGIILAEVWPSLSPHHAIDHPIKDARQVIACCTWLGRSNSNGQIARLLARPTTITPAEQRRAATEEGWIIGVQ